MVRNFNIILLFLISTLSCISSSEKENPLPKNLIIVQDHHIEDTVNEIHILDTSLVNVSNELEIKEEQIVVFLSEPCQQFIDDYKQLITDYELILLKIKEDDGNINLIIAKSSIETDLQAMLSDPVNFQCSNSKCIGSSLFLEEIESINIRKDALY